jgi:hypothetical protein
MSIPFDESTSDDTTIDSEASLAATQDDTTLDDPSMNDDAIRESFLDSEEDDESTPETREDVPADDAHALDADQPGTQNDSPVEAALGEDGQGDLAPEDEDAAGTLDDGPNDLRTSL